MLPADLFDIECDALRGSDAMFYFSSALNSPGGGAGAGGGKPAQAEQHGLVWGESGGPVSCWRLHTPATQPYSPQVWAAFRCRQWLLSPWAHSLVQEPSAVGMDLQETAAAAASLWGRGQRAS